MNIPGKQLVKMMHTQKIKLEKESEKICELLRNIISHEDKLNYLYNTVSMGIESNARQKLKMAFSEHDYSYLQAESQLKQIATEITHMQSKERMTRERIREIKSMLC